MAQVKTVTIKADTTGAVKNVKKLNKEVDDTGKKGKAAGKGLKGAFAGFSSAVAGAIPMLGRLKVAMISTGVGALVVAFGSLVALLKSAATVGADFQQALSGLEAISGATADEMGVLSRQARELGASTAYTAIQVVELQTELAKLGFSTKGITDSTPAILDLASALDVDLANAAMLAGSTVRAFGLETEDTQRVVDVLSLSASSVALDFESLKESFKNVAPAARAVGVSVEKTAALLGVLANAGVKGSRGGTQLSTAFIELNSKGLTLDQALEKISTSSNKLGTAMALAGKTGGKALVTLANETPQIAELTKTFEGAAGAAERMAFIKLDNLAGDMTRLGSAWEGFLLGIEDGEGPINKLQRFLVKGLTEGVTFLGKALDLTVFGFKDFFESIRIGLSMTNDIVSGSFGYFTGIIKKFSNEAILLISKIPYIGKAIDAEKIKANLLIAEAQLDASQKRIQEGVDKSGELTARKNTFWVRYRLSQEDKEVRLADQAAKKLEEEKTLVDQEALDARLKAEEKARAKAEADRLKLLAKFIKKEEDLLANDAIKKLDLERERAYKEIEALKITLEQKAALRLAYDQSYKLQKDAIDLTQEEKDRLGAEARIAAIDAEEKAKTAMNQRSLDGIVAIAGAESKLGKAALVAKQAMAAKELLIDMGVLQSKATKASLEAGLDAAQAGSAGTTGLAQTLKLGFPAALPFLVSYGIAAAGIISGVIRAVKGTKKVAAQVGGRASPMPSVSRPSATVGAESQAPSFNVVGTSGASQIADIIGSQPPVKAFVVSSDVTTSQSLDRNIIDSATI
jgi:hypothetical protein